jgi:hypothetical protein
MGTLMRRIRLRDEHGATLIVVMIVGTIGALLAVVIGTRSVADLRQVGDDRQWEQALHVADSAVDDTLSHLWDDGTYSTGETLPPEASGEWAAEKEWVIDQAEDNPLVTTREGQWAVVVPADAAGMFYAVGYVPDRDSALRPRVLRVQWDRAPFAPEAAVSSDGDVEISGNPTISGTAGSVHSNADIDISGDPSVSGYLSAVGDYTTTGSPTVGDPVNTGGGRPTMGLPEIEARAMYHTAQYELCPDGTVRAGPAYVGAETPNATGIPCAGGTVLKDTSDGNAYRGWRHAGNDSSQGATWAYAGSLAYDGVYYVYRGRAQISGSPGSVANPWKATILAEAEVIGDCSRKGGDIELSGTPSIEAAPSATPVTMIADRDLQINGNLSHSLSGLFGVAEQMSIGGTPVITGAFVVNDKCDTPGSPVGDGHAEISGNANITYDGNLELPISASIRTTLWLEL